MNILDQLEAAEKAATEGPWIHRTGPDDDWDVIQVDALRFFEASHDRPESMADAALIALLRNHAAELIAVARAAQNAAGALELEGDVQGAFDTLLAGLAPLLTESESA